MTASATSAPVYTDFQGLNELRVRAGKSPDDLETLRAVAGQFEALFIQMMLKSMRDASLGEGIFDNDQSETYQGLFDRQISIELGKQQGVGLADMMIQQLRPQVAAQETGVAHSKMEQTPVHGPTGSSVPAESPRAFVDSLRPHASEAAAALGVKPEVLIAQAALETGWGKFMIRRQDGTNSHNYFGIKADASWEGDRVATDTLEARDGVMHKERAVFRAYSSAAESFSDYVAFISENPRYERALEVAGDPDSYTRELQRAGYATDPEYARKIMQIADKEVFLDESAAIKDEVLTPLS